MILGTAGHIDHGKSSLVRALTGIDPDRLAEEKRRGITIELGFAQLLLEDFSFGIVDVPGHEKFVRTMVSGATGIDLVMLVIAADEGIMPQTREHLDICNLLGVQHGIVVITKTDLVEDEWLQLVHEDIQMELHDSFLQHAPIVEVSTKTSKGLENLKQTLTKLAHTIQTKELRGTVRLPIDRVFEQKGFGPVVTGTLYAGSIQEHDPVILLPEQRHGRVRGLQVHGQKVTQAQAGQRTAVNLQGINLQEIHRGQVLVQQSTLQPSQELDAHITLLSSQPKPLKHRAPLLLHAGTIQINCRLFFYDRTHLDPGTSTYARIHLETPSIFLPQDRFILRGFQRIESHGTTVGGGFVLDPFPPRRKKRLHEQLLARLHTLHHEELPAQLEMLIQEADTDGITLPLLQQRVHTTQKELQSLLPRMLSQNTIVQFEREPPRYIHHSHLQQLAQRTQTRLQEYHQQQPLHEGMNREALREQLQIPSNKLFLLLLQRMQKQEEIVLDQDIVRLPQHAVHLQADQAEIERQIRQIYQEAGLTPPRARDLPALLNISEEQLQPLLTMLSRKQLLQRVHEDLYFDTQNLAQLQEQLTSFLLEHQTITAQEFKKLTNASRKFTIPLAEYFDKQKLTIRVDDVRKLRR